MTPSELVSHLAPYDRARLALIFEYLGVKTYALTLENGKPLSDVIDFSVFCQELSTALKSPRLGEPANAPIEIRTRPRTMSRSVHDTCPRCGHVHEGDRECGVEIGRGQLCRCEMEVPA